MIVLFGKVADPEVAGALKNTEKDLRHFAAPLEII
jgi:hypothetical protein